MQVRAKKLGYYGHTKRKPGAVFTLFPIKGKARDPKTGRQSDKLFTAEEQFSDTWMEKVDGNESAEEEDEAPVSKKSKKGKKGKGHVEEPHESEEAPPEDDAY